MVAKQPNLGAADACPLGLLRERTPLRAPGVGSCRRHINHPDVATSARPPRASGLLPFNPKPGWSQPCGASAAASTATAAGGRVADIRDVGRERRAPQQPRPPRHAPPPRPAAAVIVGLPVARASRSVRDDDQAAGGVGVVGADSAMQTRQHDTRLRLRRALLQPPGRRTCPPGHLPPVAPQRAWPTTVAQRPQVTGKAARRRRHPTGGVETNAMMPCQPQLHGAPCSATFLEPPRAEPRGRSLRRPATQRHGAHGAHGARCQVSSASASSFRRRRLCPAVARDTAHTACPWAAAADAARYQRSRPCAAEQQQSGAAPDTLPTAAAAAAARRSYCCLVGVGAAATTRARARANAAPPPPPPNDVWR